MVNQVKNLPKKEFEPTFSTQVSIKEKEEEGKQKNIEDRVFQIEHELDASKGTKKDREELSDNLEERIENYKDE